MNRNAIHRMIGGTLLVTVGPAAALATPPPEAVIAGRQAGFKAMGAAMKALKAELQAPAPTGDTMLKAATMIAETAIEQGKRFPAGSGPAPGVQTAALPGIWADRATFDTQMAALVAESASLVAVAKTGDVTAIKAQVSATGAACGACHRQFRAES